MGLFSDITNIFDPSAGYKAGQKQLSQFYNQGVGYLSPYAKEGQTVSPELNTALQNLLNPGQLEQNWASSYTESPEAKATQAMATQQGLGAASSMGLLGSSPALTAIQEGTADIGLQDKQNYLHDLMNKYLAGIRLGSNIYGTGANAAGEIGRMSSQMGENSAQMAYGKASAPGSLIGSLLGAFGGYKLFGGGKGALAGAQAGGEL